MANLIIGGTSGLGLEIAKDFAGHSDEEVIVTGRHDPKVEGIRYYPFDLSDNLPARMSDFVKRLGHISTLVYAAGYFQDGTVTDLSEKQIEEMINVGERGLVYAVRAILQNQDKLDGLITITSTSQWTPREREPIYNMVKAGAGHLSNGLAEDPRIGKVLVAGPAGMDTPFWDGMNKDTSSMLDATWVAEQVMDQWQDDYQYRFVQILREPARVEQVETR